MPNRTSEERQVLVWKIIDWAEKNSPMTGEKNEVARKVGVQLGVDYHSLLDRRMLQLMSLDEAKAAFQAGVDRQLHTHRHRTPRDKYLFQKEIRDNSERIQLASGKVPVHFCYPSGDYCADFLPWLSELGVTSATTCERGLATAQSQDLLLPRFLDDSRVDLIRFQSFVAECLPKRQLQLLKTALLSLVAVQPRKLLLAAGGINRCVDHNSRQPMRSFSNSFNCSNALMNVSWVRVLRVFRIFNNSVDKQKGAPRVLLDKPGC